MRAALGSVAFFLLMSGYSMLRPVREEMGVQTGVDRLQWLFTGTFIATLLFVPLFGWFVRNVPRARLVAVVYGFFVMNLALFAVPFSTGITRPVAATFFIWLSVFNLAVVSLFWSNTSDVFTTEEAHQLYGYIAAGGSAGAIAGPAMTALLAKRVETVVLLIMAALLLTAAAICCLALRRYAHGQETTQRPIGGNVFAGITQTLASPTLRLVALLIIFYTTVSTVLYVEQAAAVKATFAHSGERTAFFATVDLIVNCTALAMQLLGTRRLVTRFGLRLTLSIVPLLVMIGLASAGAWRSVILFATLQIIHRAGEFSLVRPSREMVYTTVDAESRYKAKNFIDTTVYRANDAAASWLVAAVRGAGLNAVFLAGVPAALLWFATGYRLGRKHDTLDPSPLAPPRGERVAPSAG